MNKQDYQEELDLAAEEISNYVFQGFIPAKVEHQLLYDLMTTMRWLSTNPDIMQMHNRSRANYGVAASIMRRFRRNFHYFKEQAEKEAKEILSENKCVIKNDILKMLKHLGYELNESNGLITTSSTHKFNPKSDYLSIKNQSRFKGTPIEKVSEFGFEYVFPLVVDEIFSIEREWEDSDMYCCEFKLVTDK